jgi:glyoxylase-like metal-dependent hydrolase (beta-lactamase superfamily II)
MKMITDEIFQVGGSGLTAPEDAAIYLIRFNEDAALVDAGCGRSVDKLFSNIADCGIKPENIRYLLLTHCHFDHTGGAKAVRMRSNCQIIAHESDAPYLETGDNRVTAASWYGSKIQAFKVDRKLSGEKETIVLGGRNVEAIHVPGHSPGSVVYLVESEGKKVLFAQDVHGPLDKSLLSDRNDYTRSLLKIIALESDILCEGHFGIYTGKDRVKAFISDFLA